MTSKTILEITIIIAVLVASAAFGGSAMADSACTPSTTTLCLIVQETSSGKSSDDAEERKSSGNMFLNSGDIDLSENYIGAVRFQVPIPQGAIIQSAHILWTSEDNDSGVNANAKIHAEAIDDALTFNICKC